MTIECAYNECRRCIHASHLRNKDRFVIKIMNNKHTCRVGLQNRYHPKASKHWISNIVKEKLQDMPLYRLTDIVKDIHRDMVWNRYIIKHGMEKRLPSRRSMVRGQYLMKGYDGIMMSFFRPTSTA